jgi:hypothetical protein
LARKALLASSATAPDAVLRMLLAGLSLTDRAGADVISDVVGPAIAIVVGVGSAIPSCAKHFSHTVTERTIDARLCAPLTDSEIGRRATGLCEPIDAVTTLIGDAVTITVVSGHAGIRSLRPLRAFAGAPFARSSTIRAHACPGSSAARAAPVEPRMFVAGLDGPRQANADFVDSVVRLAIAVVVGF